MELGARVAKEIASLSPKYAFAVMKEEMRSREGGREVARLR